jgi:hypothetical protein
MRQVAGGPNLLEVAGKKFVKNFRESISLPTLENVGPGILGLISEVISMVSYMEQGSGCYLDEAYGK